MMKRGVPSGKEMAGSDSIYTHRAILKRNCGDFLKTTINRKTVNMSLLSIS